MRIGKRLSQAPQENSSDLNRIFFSRKVSEINDSQDHMNAASMLTTASNIGKLEDIKRVRYGNKVMKRIFAKQILNREHKD